MAAEKSPGAILSLILAILHISFWQTIQLNRARHREPRLSQAIDLESKERQDRGYDIVAAGLQQPAEVLRNIPPEISCVAPEGALAASA